MATEVESYTDKVEPNEDLKNENDAIELDPKQKRYRRAKTACMFFIWVNIGLCCSIVNPTIIDLKENVGVTYEAISRVLVAKSVGMLCGSVLGGSVADKYRDKIDLCLFVMLCMMSAGLAAVPWCSTLLTLGVAFFAQGVAHCGLSACGNLMILMMWGKEASSPFQALHLGFGVGATVAPLLTAPFLSSAINTTNTTTSIGHFSHMINNDGIDWFDTTTAAGRVIMNRTATEIYIPYSICGGIALLTGLIFLGFFIRGVPAFLNSKIESGKTWMDVFSPRACAGDETCFGVFMLMSLFFLYMAIVGRDGSIGTFLLPLAVESNLEFSKQEAAYLSTVYTVCYALVRLVTSILGKWVSVHIMLFTEVAATVVISILLILFGFQSKLSYWILTCLFGFSIGSIYPHALLWADVYIEMTGIAIAIIDLGLSIGALLFPWLSGYLYTYISQISVLYLCSGASVFFAVLLVGTQIVASFYGDRYARAERVQQGTTENVDERTPLIN